MSRTISIDPVTRIEGHARISLMLDDAGAVQDAHFHVTQYRGFEKLVVGRPFQEMPSLMARICGICPVSHLMASSKACDMLLAVRVPPPAAKLREIMNLAQVAQSHALSFFYLSAPDLLFGMDGDPAKRNIFGILQTDPALARDGVKLRSTGQKIIEILGGKRIHPAWVVPGGVNEPLSAEKREQILAMLPETIKAAQRSLKWFEDQIDRFGPEIESFANFPTLFLGLVNRRGTLETYDGDMRVTGPDGKILDQRPPEEYTEFIGEAVEKFSYLKSPYYKPMGYPDGIYRVGPLARLNMIDRIGTPLAEEYFPKFKALDVQSSFHFHYARLIEILYAFERIEILLNDKDILSTHVRAEAQANAFEGVGTSEAPRGNLLHHYKIDENGLMISANLIIATGHNNLAMNRGVLQVAQKFIKAGEDITDGMLNRVEAVIRAYDPCLSCSTHAAGQMPLQIQMLAPDGTLVQEVKR
jgi:NAD-reducing hydrogenase large subunit